MLLARVLSGIPGTEASRALVRLLLAETESEVRAVVLEAIDHRDSPEARAELLKALHARAPEVVNRAAWALSQMRVISAVPALIGVLVTSRVETVMAPSTPGSGDGGGISPIFGSVSPTQAYGSAAINYSGYSGSYLTGVAMAPGAVAYGAASLPYYNLAAPNQPAIPTLPNYGSTAGILGGGGMAASRGPSPRLITISIQNVEVRRALIRLTDQDFGFDIAAWKHWVRASFQPEPIPARRVVQP